MAALYRVMVAVESGEMERARASALAAVSLAIVGVYEAGLVESKIAELEGEIAGRAAGNRRSANDSSAWSKRHRVTIGCRSC